MNAATKSGATAYRQDPSESETTSGEAEAVESAASERREPAGDIRPVTSAPEQAQERAAPQEQAEETREGEAIGFDAVHRRLERLERQNRWLKIGVFGLLVAVGIGAYQKYFPEGVLIQKTMLESKELKLLDSDGQARLFLRMYSRVPVLQLMDEKGKPRMSLGLRFDDSPFIDLSDKTGQTRATLELTQDDRPALQLYDEDGEVTFRIR